MISLSEFRKFVNFIEQKIQPLATQFEEFRFAAIEVREKAKEIEKSMVTGSEESEILQFEEETDQLSDQHPTSPVPSESQQSDHSFIEAPQQVKRRKTRVRRKINQVCKGYFMFLCHHSIHSFIF